MNLFDKSRAKIADLLTQTMTLIQNTYAQSTQMFTVASAWGQILFVLQNLSQFILFFIEDSITELNMQTATRESSIFGLAALTGHNASRASSAIGQIQISWNGNDPSEVGGGAILIPNKAAVKYVPNNAAYIINLSQDTIRFNLSGTSIFNCQIMQGVVKTSKFTGTGLPLQSFNVSERYTAAIENSEVSVYVNGILYTNYLSLYDIPYNYNGVLVRTSVSQGIDIIFGNGNMGSIPPAGAIILVNYLETTGITGNINSTNPANINFSFNDSGTDIFGNQISLADYLNISCITPPQMGAAAESVVLTRILAPRTSQAYVLANPDSYVTFFEKFGTFSIIQAYNTNSNNTYIDDENIIYILLVPDVTLLLTSNENYFNLVETDFILSDFQQTEILNLLQKSGQQIVGTEVKIVIPNISRYVINTILTIYEGYDPTTVENAIVDIYSQYFLSIRRRDIIPRSDLVSLVDSIPGVDSVMIFFVSEENEKYITSLSGLPANDPRRDILVGLNSFGDIVIGQNDIAVISGGWSDSNGTYYDTGADLNKLSSVNISITGYTPVTYNTQVNAMNKASIISTSSTSTITAS